MKALRHIGLAFLLALAALSCSRNGRIIPAGKFAKIYVRMLLADQHAQQENKVARAADTTLFYEPILNEFGYSRLDYVKSVSHYMEDPESFEKIFKKAKDILDAHVKELTAEERARKRADSIRTAIAKMDFLRAPVYFGMPADSARRDTVAIRLDTNDIYVWARIMPDTIYSGPIFRVKTAPDTLAVKADSVETKQVQTGGAIPVKLDETVRPVSAPVKEDTKIIVPKTEDNAPKNISKFRRIEKNQDRATTGK